MDSKSKMLVITFSALMVGLVVGLVAFLNLSQRAEQRRRAERAAEAGSVADAGEPEEGGFYMDQATAEHYGLNPSRDPYAFLQDESFFQAKEPDIVEAPDSLSLLSSSIQKDLRIFVVNAAGAVVEGTPFEITIRNGAGDELKISDSDKDGILYTDGLKAGDYRVTLSPVQGFQVPFEAMDVSISDEISYTVLKDISYLIRDESQVDAEVEDTAVREAENDADGTETNVRLQDGVSIFGIDVSKWNKQIDWQKVKNAGVDFAIIRCGYRGSSSGYLIEDPYFEENIKNATAAGVRVGVYFFTQAVTPAEGVEEASMVLSLIDGYDTAFPLYIDTEGAGGHGRADGLNKESRTAAIKAFCETIEGAGYVSGIYASKYWLMNNLDMEKLSPYRVWLAQYSSKASYDGPYDMWQYTSAGRIDGIGTLVDYDLSYVDFASSRRSAEKPERLDGGEDGAGQADEAGQEDTAGQADEQSLGDT